MDPCKLCHSGTTVSSFIARSARGTLHERGSFAVGTETCSRQQVVGAVESALTYCRIRNYRSAAAILVRGPYVGLCPILMSPVKRGMWSDGASNPFRSALSPSGVGLGALLSQNAARPASRSGGGNKRRTRARRLLVAMRRASGARDMSGTLAIHAGRTVPEDRTGLAPARVGQRGTENERARHRRGRQEWSVIAQQLGADGECLRPDRGSAAEEPYRIHPTATLS